MKRIFLFLRFQTYIDPNSQAINTQGVARVSKNGFTTFTGLQVGSITTTAGAVAPDKPAKVRDEFGYHMDTCRTSGDDTMGLVNIVRFVYKTLFGHVLKNLPQVSMSINLRKHGLLKLEDWRKYNALWQKMKTVQW